MSNTFGIEVFLERREPNPDFMNDATHDRVHGRTEHICWIEDIAGFIAQMQKDAIKEGQYIRQITKEEYRAWKWGKK